MYLFNVLIDIRSLSAVSCDDSNSLLWDNDASYEYYRHGPLARTVLGSKQVQGIDYAYTIQGWLKAINGKDQLRLSDIGGDGDPLSTTNRVADDAFSMMLTYYGATGNRTADYSPVGRSNSNVANKFTGTAPAANNDLNNLFNGNIKGMTVGFNDSLKVRALPTLTLPGVVLPDMVSVPTAHYAYKYDQLNRLLTVNTSLGLSAALTTGAGNRYNSNIVYDANGNIKQLQRNGNNSFSLSMDNLSYTYPLTPDGKLLNNRLSKVSDAQTNRNAYDNDFDNGSTANQTYEYDNIGNLVKDLNDSIAEIKWDNRGKITSITTNKRNGNHLEFAYDAIGNRITKVVKPLVNGVLLPEEQWLYTYYVRDAQGNIMATNELKISPMGGGKFNERLILQELDVYGSSRLGTATPIAVSIGTAEFMNGGKDATGRYIRNKYLSYAETAGFGRPALRHIMGQKNYEITNHLGNVMATLSDRKLTINTAASVFPNVTNGNIFQPTYLSFLPEISSFQDYYSGGSPCLDDNLAQENTDMA